jgi:hypothetical protein
MQALLRETEGEAGLCLPRPPYDLFPDYLAASEPGEPSEKLSERCTAGV